jgi:hypothetical protein
MLVESFDEYSTNLKSADPVEKYGKTTNRK